MLVDVSLCTGSDQGFTDELVTAIAQEQALALDPLVEFSLFGQVILYFKQISEVSSCLHAHFEIDSFVFMIEDSQFLEKAVADGSCANDRLVGIDIDGTGS